MKEKEDLDEEEMGSDASVAPLEFLKKLKWVDGALFHAIRTMRSFFVQRPPLFKKLKNTHVKQF